MAGRQRAAGAGRAGGHREALPVQFVQQRLAVDVETGEGDDPGQPPLGVADHLHVRHGLRHPGPDPLRQLPQPYRLLGRLRPHRAQGRRGRHDRRDVLEPGCPPRLPLVHRPLGGEPHPLADDEQPHPGRPAPLVRTGRQQRPVALDGPPRQRLRRVHQQRHPRGPAHLGHLAHRLHGPHLVVGRLQTGECGVRAKSGRVARRVHQAGPVHRHLGHRSTVRLEHLRRMEHGGVFDG